MLHITSVYKTMYIIHVGDDSLTLKKMHISTFQYYLLSWAMGCGGGSMYIPLLGV